jgi:hypothetical protein
MYHPKICQSRSIIVCYVQGLKNDNAKKIAGLNVFRFSNNSKYPAKGDHKIPKYHLEHSHSIHLSSRVRKVH